MSEAKMGRRKAVATAHKRDDETVFPPRRSFLSDATALGRQIIIISTASSVPVLIARSYRLPSTLMSQPASPSSRAVARPRNTAVR